MLKQLFLWTIIMCGVFSLTACNTFEGAGEDVQAVGEGMQDVAK